MPSSGAVNKGQKHARAATTSIKANTNTNRRFWTASTENVKLWRWNYLYPLFSWNLFDMYFFPNETFKLMLSEKIPKQFPLSYFCSSKISFYFCCIVLFALTKKNFFLFFYSSLFFKNRPTPEMNPTLSTNE